MKVIKGEYRRYPEYEAMDRDALHHEQRAIGERLGRLHQEVAEQKKRNHAIRQRIAEVSGTSTGFGITDHALVRYLERVKGVDIKAIRDEIRVLAAAHGRKPRYEMQIGADTVEQFVIHGDRVVTVLPEALTFPKKSHV